jgi:hypothetical protein
MNTYDENGIVPNALRGGTPLKYKDGVYSDAAGNLLKPGVRLLVLEMNVILQRWRNGIAEFIERDPAGKLPDPEQLNEQIPASEWELGLDGQPRKPWARNFRIFFADPDTGAKWTYIHDSVGANRAYHELKNAMETKKFLFGVNLLPLVELVSGKTFKTRFGLKPRPTFFPVLWFGRGPDGALLPQPQFGTPPRQITAKAQTQAAQEGLRPVPPEDYYDDAVPF